MSLHVTGKSKLAWSLQEISEATGLSVNFLRGEVRRRSLKTTRFGTRILVIGEDLKEYLATGSKGGIREAPGDSKV